jgi:hypothetical protein
MNWVTTHVHRHQQQQEDEKRAMTEGQWLVCTDPATMLDYLGVNRVVFGRPLYHRMLQFVLGWDLTWWLIRPKSLPWARKVPPWKECLKIWLGRQRRERPSERKLRLFSSACCRRVWPLLRDERSQQAIEIAELAAAGLDTPSELRDAQQAAHDVWASVRDHPVSTHAAYA